MPEQRRPLGELAVESRLAGLELALELVAPRGEAVDPGDDRVLPAPEPVGRERRLPAVVAERLQRRLGPALLARRRGGAATARRTSWPSAKIVAETSQLVAERALDREAAAVDARRDVLDLDPRRARARRRRHASSWACRRSCWNECHRTHLARSSGVLLHPTSLPGGRLGPEAFAFVDWLAAAGQIWWQVLPLAPARPARLALHAAVGLRGLAGLARRARRAGRGRPSSRRSGRGTRFWAAELGALRRSGRARRPGALRARVGGAPRLRGGARACG